MPLPKAHPHEACDTCPYHSTEVYRMDLAESSIISLNTCYKSVKVDQAEIKTKLALLDQKFNNIRYPIWIIFTMVLIEIAKALFSFGPLIKTVAATAGGSL